MVKKKVLFVCVHNSARSQIAEALMNEMYSESHEFHSAGFSAGTIHPLTVELLEEKGLDTSSIFAKGFSDLKVDEYDIIISVCDREVEACPNIQADALTMNLPFVDPAALTKGLSNEEGMEIFRQSWREIRLRLRHVFQQLEVREERENKKSLRESLEKEYQQDTYEKNVRHLVEINKIAPNLGDTYRCIRRNDLDLFMTKEASSLTTDDAVGWVAFAVGMFVAYLTSDFNDNFILSGDHTSLLFLFAALFSGIFAIVKVLRQRRSISVGEYIKRIIRRFY